MAIRYCSFATRGYHLRQWMQMMSLRLADSSVELSCWNLNRLEREGIREAIPWFDPNLQTRQNSRCKYPYTMSKRR